MSTDLERDGNEAARQPIEAVEDLNGYFAAGCKPRQEWALGLEYERLGVHRKTARAVPYFGAGSVSALFEDLAVHRGWEVLREDGHPIALRRNGTMVTLEPGGQTELSSAIHPTLAGLRDELCTFVTELNESATAQGISWIGLGLQPFSEQAEIEWVPKKRYGIMSAHLAQTGRLAHDMMKRTAGIQVNLDYSSESDASAKFRALMGVSPIITALFANSPLSAGEPTGMMSSRAAIWLETDPARCGLLPFAFEDRPLFATYLDWALDVPMLFVVRDGAWHRVETTFRKFIEEGFDGLSAVRADWTMHLTTLFPDVRLKQIVEARFADSADAALALAHAALIKGIVYDNAAVVRTWELVKGLSWEGRLALHQDVCRMGLHAEAGGVPVRELARSLVDIARDGLKHQAGPDGSDETGFLDPLEIILADGESPARRLLRLWETKFGNDPAKLVAHLSQVNLACYER